MKIICDSNIKIIVEQEDENYVATISIENIGIVKSEKSNREYSAISDAIARLKPMIIEIAKAK
jgi:hypothetical protein